MDLEKYIYRLNDELSEEIKVLLSEEKEFLIRNYRLIIDHIDRVFPQPKLENINVPNLFSGNNVQIWVDCDISLFEKSKDGNGTRGRTVKVWFQEVLIRYDHEKENFQIIELGPFLAHDF